MHSVKHVVDTSSAASPPGPTLVEAVQRRDAGRVGLLLVLCVAAADGSVQLLRLLLDAGADVNARGGLPLVHSVDGGHLKAARLLLDRGAEPDALKGEALRLATRYARQDIVVLLLQRGAAPVQGPPAMLPSEPAQDGDGNKGNELP